MKHLGNTNFISFEYGKDTWKIYHIMGGCKFYVENENVRICFNAEGRSGSTYTKIESVWNKAKDRVYTAQRYQYKYLSLVSEAGYILAKNDYLWDYEQQCPLIETRKKALKPYYGKCEELGIAY